MKFLRGLFASDTAKPSRIEPTATRTDEFPADMRREAKENPGGWVYEISPGFDPNGAVPPEAIRGAWKVDDSGEIVPGSFQANPNFRAPK